MSEREPNGRFAPGNKVSGGRRPGCKDKLTRCVKEAIILAAESVGEDGKGRNGLMGYLRRVALRDPKTFCQLVGKLVPIDLRSTTEPVVTYRSVEEVEAELASRGITPDYMLVMAESAARRAKANGGNGNGSLDGGGNLN